MASVYVALDGRLDREVALKIMRPGLATDDVFVERFRAEARSAARLSHPNVVAVFDQGEDDGEVFLAMELVEGKTLRDVIHEEAPLTAREALAILEPILLALQRGPRGRHDPPRRQARERHRAARRRGQGRRLRPRSRHHQPGRDEPDGRPAGHRLLPLPRAGRARRRRHAQRRVCRGPAPLRDAHRAQGRHRRHPDPDRVQPRPRLDRHAELGRPRRPRPRSTSSSPARRPSSPTTASSRPPRSSLPCGRCVAASRPTSSTDAASRSRTDPRAPPRRCRPCRRRRTCPHRLGRSGPTCPAPPSDTAPDPTRSDARPSPGCPSTTTAPPSSTPQPCRSTGGPAADDGGRSGSRPSSSSAVSRSAAGGSRPDREARPSCRPSSVSRSRRPRARSNRPP